MSDPSARDAKRKRVRAFTVAQDRERDDGDGRVLVLFVDRETTAWDFEIPGVGEPLCDYKENTAYPTDDPVAAVAFIDALQREYGDAWREWGLRDVLRNTLLYDDFPRVYTYPASRLKPTDHDSNHD